ncbi:non-ribosomal peptide synthetase, partial [uncultured Paenibacillus sp.]|uniref:non-ribosomal peptide synthetase n=1 Tax=uncultured Paenibacillus sp. TaxID=227322 RepID=UPI0025E95900
MSKPDIADIYPLSPMQEALLFHSLYDQGDVYFEQMIFTLEGSVNIRAMESSLNAVIRRYDILRTIFIHDKINRPRQVVLKERTLQLETVDVSERSKAEQRDVIQRLAEEDRQRAFDLSKDLLLRLKLIKTGESAYDLIWSNHHILLDGWCLGILFQEWFSLYKEENGGEKARLPRVIPYKNYIRWLESRDQTEARKYWRDYLSGYEAIEVLPVQRTALHQEAPRIEEIMFNLGTELTERLVALSRRYQVTMNSLFQTVWGVMLHYYSDAEDVVFGTVVSGRSPSIPDVEKIVGLMINAVPVRIQAAPDQSFAQLLMKTHQNGILSEEHSFLSLAEIQSETGIAPLFNHILVYENYPSSESMFDTDKLDLGFKITSIEAFEHTNYDLNISIGPGAELRVKMNYNNRVYSADAIERLFRHLEHVCLQVTADPDRKLPDIEVLTPQEKWNIAAFNETAADYPRERTLVELFVAQALQHPDHPAVVFGSEQWTYSELHERSEQWARGLQRRGVAIGDVVGLAARRSADMIAGMLAVLKAGAAYIPLDPDFPEERLTGILNDSGARHLFLLTALRLPGFQGETILAGDLEPAGDDDARTAPACGLELSPDSPAYIIYTSGSTGQPKGVVATHRNVAKTILNNGYVQLDRSDRILQISNYAFDGATFDIYGALLHGATLVLLSREELLSAELLAASFDKYSISVAFMTTALFNALVDWDPTCFNNLRRVLFGGEKGSVKHVNKALAALGPGRLLHMYGPTETTVYATCHPVTQPDTLPIGRPIHNTTAYVLNRRRQPMPAGVPGELYIGGEGLALGYWRQPERTAEQFIANPFSPGERLYRTGDRVRMLPDGTIDFLERIDQQLKIRGHRIEPGEIAEELKALPGVQDGLVIPWRDKQGHDCLCAYIVPERGVPVSEEDAQANGHERIQSWRKALKDRLPEYMIPASFQMVESFPLTPNGKVYRHRLPEPRRPVQGARVPLTGDTEAALAKIWGEVLGAERFGADDHFFELGGHSLKAMMLTAKIHKELGVRLTLHEVFQNPVLREMAACIRTAKQSDYEPLLPAPEQEAYPASSAQKRVYIAQQLDPGQTSYNMPMVLEIEGTIDKAKLEQAFIRLIERHESLRTSFAWSGGMLCQRVIGRDEFAWSLDCRQARPEDRGSDRPEAVESEERQSRITRLLRSFIRPFDLGSGPLIRAMLAEFSDRLSVLFIDIHHIVCDGISMGIIYRDLTRLYRGEALSPAKIQYKDYAVFEQRNRNHERYESNRKYWKEQFAGKLPEAELMTDYVRPSIRSYDGRTLAFQLDPRMTGRLKRLGAAQGATLYMVLLAAYNLLLSKYSGKEDIVVGVPTAGRHHEDVQGIVGMFVNTLALRTHADGSLPVQEWIGRVKEGIMRAQAHGDYPLEDLLEDLDLSRDLSRHPLFDTMFVLQNMDIEPIEMDGTTFRTAEWEWRHAKFDMTWSGRESVEGMTFVVEFAACLYEPATIQRMIDHFIVILEQMTASPDRLLRDIDMLTAEERAWLAARNETAASYPAQASVSLLFEQQAAVSADHPALIYGSRMMTYRELNEAAKRFAAVLGSKGIGRGDRVGLLAERSMEMMIAIFGILRTGAAYVPLDPAFPEERKLDILNDCGARWLVATDGLDVSQFQGGYLEYGITVREADAWSGMLAEERELAAGPGPNDIAYIMYTSGSAGKPKGVLTSHRNIVKTSVNNGFANLTGEDRMLQLSNYAFDGSTYEIFGALLNGATLVLISRDDLLDAAELARIMDEQRVTSAFMTAALFNTMVDYHLECFKHMRKLFFGGEAASVQHVAKALDYLGENRIVNSYGPTETTVFATTYPVRKQVIGKRSVPIGKPIRNTQIYVLNPWGQMQPPGIPGELYIGGGGVAQGYLNRQQLTEQRFLPNPFLPGEKMYRTGDLARWLPDGELEYLGRLDQQVKIRGNRVEPGEIESKLISLTSVREAAVIPKRDSRGSVYLCAYVVYEQGAAERMKEEREAAHWQRKLRRTLPDYMIPAAFVVLDALPLTANGKIDRSALPEPSLAMPDGAKEAPGNEDEAKLHRLWAEVLGVDGHGIDDHFFELGGHSLKAMQLAAKVHQCFDVKLRLQDIFNYPTIREQATFIRGAEHKRLDRASIPLAPVQDDYPATPAQKRLYIVSQYEHAGTSYNMPMALRIVGDLNIPALERAFIQLIGRHESLRTSFHMDGDEVKQRIHPVSQLGWQLEVLEIAEDDSAHPAASGENAGGLPAPWIRPFDLAAPCLLRAVLWKMQEKGYLLFIDIHHIVSDGVSTAVLYDELFRLYSGEELPPLDIQYKDYAMWEQDRRGSESYAAAKSYWHALYREPAPVLELPLDRTRPRVQRYEGAKYSFTLPGGLVSKLTEKSKDQEITVFMALLSAYFILLSKYSGQEDIAVGMPVAGRDHADTESLIGMFVKTLALRSYPKADLRVGEYVGQVKKAVLEAYEHSVYPLEELLEHVDLARDPSRHPFFDTLFVLQNMSIAKLELPGLLIEQEEAPLDRSKFDMTWAGLEKEDQILMTIEYNTEIFSHATIRRMSVHYEHILRQMAEQEASRIRDIELITEAERLELLRLEGGSADYPREASIPELFAEQARLRPNHPALVWGSEQVAYGELRERAQCLADRLRQRGVGTGEAVGLIADRSIGMIESILGILAAGAAYVPLDPGFPPERLAQMLEDSGARILLAQDGMAVPGFTGITLPLDEGPRAEAGTRAAVEDLTIPAESAAYIMYTSGSTGTPKGVMITHRNVIKTSIRNGFMEMLPEDRVLQLSNYAFDGSTYEIFGALLNGATLVLLPKHSVLDAGELARTFEEQRITTAFMTAALFNTVVDWDVTCLKHVRKLFFGGEAGSKKHVVKALEYLGPNRIANGYGPTETTVFATTYTVDESMRERSSVPIGRPVNNTRVCVLNRWGQRQPVGVPGELYIGGDGLAREYVNRPDLTAEKFVPNPLVPGERAYRTGDLVRWLPDGNLEFLGRLDRQVKIRGNRIELSEVESRLRSLAEVQEAAVVPGRDEQGHSFLAAYVVPAVAEQEGLAALIRERLQRLLPDYMVPSSFTLLDKLPLTGNGKVDAASLPAHQRLGSGDCQAPANETEHRLAEIWADLLGVRQVGVNDHFFALGGHSLKAMTLIARIHKEFHVKLSLQDVFARPTVQEQSGLIQQEKGRDTHVPLMPAPKQDTYPVSSAQWRLYYIQQLDKEGTSYNMPMAFELRGQLHEGRLRKAFASLICRHESLRTTFAIVGEELRQKIWPAGELRFHLEQAEYSGDAEDEAGIRARTEEYIGSFVRPFHLSEPPLFRAGLLRLSATRHLLAIDIHHSVSDGISTGIMMRELFQLYEGQELADVSIQYKDYAVWEQRQKQGGMYRQNEKFWLDLLQGELPALRLPYDASRSGNEASEGAEARLRIDREVTRLLEELAATRRTTLFAVLLAAYSILLSKYSGEEDMIIGTPISGRQHADAAEIVGMFVNTLPLRLAPRGDLELHSYIGEVGDRLLDAFEHGMYPLEDLMEKLNVPRDASRHPLFDTLFILQNIEEFSFADTELHVRQLNAGTREPKFDMTWGAVETSDGLSVTVEYNRSLFLPGTIERMLAHYEHILRQMAEQEASRIRDIELITEAERLELLRLEGGSADYPREASIPELFAEQARLRPNHPALVWGSEQVAYGELRERAQCLADRLRQRGVGTGEAVGLIADRSIGMIESILGILAAGAAYVPLDPGFPPERLAQMLEDSGARILLAQDGMAVPGFTGITLPLDEGPRAEAGTRAAVEDLTIPAESAAYIMYTSGSTGTPKGVMITHRNVIKTSIRNGFMEMLPEDRVLQLSNYAFDGSTYEIFGALLNGATLVLLPKHSVLDAGELARTFEEQRITTAFMTAALFNTVVDWDVTCLKHVRKLFFGGEAGSKKHVVKALEYLGPNRIANGYGPTETTVFATTYTVDESMRERSSVPIGRPVNNTRVCVLNRWGQRQPVGVPGELYIGGDGLAREYVNRPDLTAEKFVPNPLVPGERAYRTGDLVRWLPDGNLEFLGRLDRQVKIRGNRIELSEVESRLRSLAEVQEAAVVPGRDEQGHSFLAAYVVPAVAEQEGLAALIRERLQRLLPD